MGETWKSISGYVGLYEVSNMGNIRSVERTVTYKDGRVFRYPSTVLKHQKHWRGYAYVSLSKNGKYASFKVHRLVAEAFIPNPENKPEVNHKNGDKWKNHVDNLEWSTRRENMIHAGKNGYLSSRRERGNGLST